MKVWLVALFAALVLAAAMQEAEGTSVSIVVCCFMSEIVHDSFNEIHFVFSTSDCSKDFKLLIQKGRSQNSLPLTTYFSQNVTKPFKGISYPVGDLCQPFTKLTGPCAYTLHSNLIPPTVGTNGHL